MSPGNPRKSLSDGHMPDRACIDSPWIRELSGRGVAVAVIDSGVNPEHPHVSRVAGGVRIVNLSLGTLREDHAGVLEGAVGRPGGGGGRGGGGGGGRGADVVAGFAAVDGGGGGVAGGVARTPCYVKGTNSCASPGSSRCMALSRATAASSGLGLPLRRASRTRSSVRRSQ